MVAPAALERRVDEGETAGAHRMAAGDGIASITSTRAPWLSASSAAARPGDAGTDDDDVGIGGHGIGRLAGRHRQCGDDGQRSQAAPGRHYAVVLFRGCIVTAAGPPTLRQYTSRRTMAISRRTIILGSLAAGGGGWPYGPSPGGWTTAPRPRASLPPRRGRRPSTPG
ncbi:MAG: hypothetical protein M5R42_20405 [Rhodocyclaceae bacterium]|nr:hypothetical protein [Rhodocyclaceae bacterium]